MKGIDISSWEQGIKIAQTDAEFVIVKATQGTGYYNPGCYTMANDTLASGKLLGLYHYVQGGNAEGEADHFAGFAKEFSGKALLAVDWEQVQNSAWGDLGYLEALVRAVISKTGLKPLIYCSQAYFPWDLAQRLGCGAWVAQYASNQTTGWQDSPWNEGAYSCTIRQYTSNGRIKGYQKALDLNKSYIGRDEWASCAKPAGETSSTERFDVNRAARDVLAGMYGDGDDRRAALGSHYEEVQARVNELYGLARKVADGYYGNGAARRAALGDDYDAVQGIVNDMLRG